MRRVRAFVTDQFDLPLPPDHRFPVAKYRLLRQRVEASGLFAPADLVTAPAATEEELLRVHTPEYLRKLLTGTLSDAEVRRIGFPYTPAMVERSRRTAGATAAAARAALDDGIAVNLAGGTHHAFPDAGEGFCIFNDVAVAARAMQAEGRIERAVVIDLDVHQGNGTAAIFRADDTVFTFSVHGEKNFPLRREPSDLDIGLPDGADDLAYLKAVEEGTWEALYRAGADVAFYLAGADPHEGDRLGRMKVTKAGLARRSEIVLELCSRDKLPVVVTMAGGYGRDIDDSVDVYFDTVRLCHDWSRRWGR
ncbi:MAG: histone deacetylase family protein [Gemmataceae bacterium]